MDSRQLVVLGNEHFILNSISQREELIDHAIMDLEIRENVQATLQALPESAGMVLQSQRIRQAQCHGIYIVQSGF